jgi:hypothetical protein
MSDTISGVLGQVKGGKLRALGVTTKTRSAVLPEVPTLHEQGLTDFEDVTWNGIVAPAAAGVGPVLVAPVDDDGGAEDDVVARGAGQGDEVEPGAAVLVPAEDSRALFGPLRTRVQGVVDRRFFRSKYDATKTLDAFSTKLRDETDLEALSGDLVGVVRETMQPAHVSLWLRPDTAPKGE